MDLSINEMLLGLTIDGSELYLPAGYELIRKDRVRNGPRNVSGICFYVRCNLNYKIGDGLNSENLELLVLEKR